MQQSLTPLRVDLSFDVGLTFLLCLLLVASLSTFISVEGTNCTQGFYFSEDDSACVACGKCPLNEEESQPCTRNSNIVCRCIDGYYRLYPSWSYWAAMTCAPCSTCGNRGVLRKCTDHSDTVCKSCPLNTFLYNNTYCEACSPCPDGVFTVKMKDCELAGLPSWLQCEPREGTNATFNLSYVPPYATEGVFISSSTVDSVFSGEIEAAENSIMIAGVATVAGVALMLCAAILTLVCCAHLCCCKCRESGSWSRSFTMQRRLNPSIQATSYEELSVQETEDWIPG